MSDSHWWGVAEAAAHCRIKPGTWRDYVARGHAPQPDDPDKGALPNRRRPRWRADTVRAWQSARPGKGGRPLRKAPDPLEPMIRAGEAAGMYAVDPTDRRKT